jgi:dienelactone hydrolase
VRRFTLCLILVVAASWGVMAAAAWPQEVQTVGFTSPADGSEQKTLLFVPPGDEPVPLLVAFHTWSNDYRQDESAYARWCIARGWAFLHPDVRGPANRPEAAGSELAMATSAPRSTWPGPPAASTTSGSTPSASRAAG